MLPRLLDNIDSAEAGRYSLERLAALTLQHAQDAARNLKMLQDTRAQLKEVTLYINIRERLEHFPSSVDANVKQGTVLNLSKHTLPEQIS